MGVHRNFWRGGGQIMFGGGQKNILLVTPMLLIETDWSENDLIQLPESSLMLKDFLHKTISRKRLMVKLFFLKISFFLFSSSFPRFLFLFSGCDVRGSCFRATSTFRPSLPLSNMSKSTPFFDGHQKSFGFSALSRFRQRRLFHEFWRARPGLKQDRFETRLG